MAKRILTLAGGLRILVWLYLALVLAVWLLLALGGDRWWLATVMLFGPRWVYGLPLALLVPAAAVWRRRLLWPLAAAAIVAVGPIMGLCLPWARLAAPQGPTLRVLTCNLKGRCHDNAVLNDLIRTAAPDIVALQGCWAEARVAWPEGWHVCQEGEMLVASRYPLSEIPRLPQVSPGENGGEAASNWRLRMLGCLVAAPQGDLAFCTVHPESPHQSISRLLSRDTVLRPSQSGQMATEIERRWLDSAELSQWLQERDGVQIIAGDLNTADRQRDLSHILGRLSQRLQRGRAGVRLHGVAPGTALAVRDPHRPYPQQPQLAAMPRLGRARRRLRPPAADRGPGVGAGRG